MEDKHKRIALFGPPGSGKSYLIKQARDRGWLAFDLEDYRAIRRPIILARFNSEPEASWIVAADGMSVDLFDRSTFTTVLLLPPQEVLTVWRIRRDSGQPSKANQPYDLRAKFEAGSARYDHIYTQGAIDGAPDLTALSKAIGQGWRLKRNHYREQDRERIRHAREYWGTDLLTRPTDEDIYYDDE